MNLNVFDKFFFLKKFIKAIVTIGPDNSLFAIEDGTNKLILKFLV